MTLFQYWWLNSSDWNSSGCWLMSMLVNIMILMPQWYDQNGYRRPNLFRATTYQSGAYIACTHKIVHIYMMLSFPSDVNASVWIIPQPNGWVGVLDIKKTSSFVFKSSLHINHSCLLSWFIAKFISFNVHKTTPILMVLMWSALFDTPTNNRQFP